MQPQTATSAARKSAPLPWYHRGLRFTCRQCGRCCGGPPGYVWVNREDVARIARFLGMQERAFLRQHVRRVDGAWSLLERADGDCEFLRREGDGRIRCAIHAARPLQCRTWPFWASNLRSRRAWEQAARECPGMNAGRYHPLPVIRAALRRTEQAGLDL